MRASGLPTWVLVASVVVGAVLACVAEPGGEAPGAFGQGVYLPAHWQSARNVTGHRVHVVSERIACSACHVFGESSIGTVTPARCAACHERESRIEHAPEQARKRFGTETRSDCTTCHAFTLDGTGHATPDGGGDAGASLSRAFAPTACDRCHQERQGSVPAVRVHGTSACTDCHRVHETEGPVPAACESCHADVTAVHANAGRTTTGVCTTCHEHQHAPASDALENCAGCHAQTEPVVPATALFAGGHSECVGCHQPHDFSKAKATACGSCHEGVRAFAAPRVPAHARCESCHAPHDVRGSPEAACGRCHGSVHADHPQKSGPCTTCHDPHPANTSSAARQCSSCHQTAASEHAFHGGAACTDCHTPHDFVLASDERGACRRCHAGPLAKTATLSGHSSCEGCHGGLPHHPARLRAGCETCHAGVHQAATAGHRKCLDCHEPHAGDTSKACRDCHRTEHLTASAGHRSCLDCHQPHSGAPSKTSCASCHREQAQGAHGMISSDCASCHRPHGPKGVAQPPGCRSCHAPTSLPGLHRYAEHQSCSGCHSGHSPADSALRAACTGCHAAQLRHFPEAERCTGCHLFNANQPP